MPVRSDIYGIGIKIHTPDQVMNESEIRMRLVGPINAAIGDLLITAEDLDEEATDTAERLYRAAKECGIDVSGYDEQIAKAVESFHNLAIVEDQEIVDKEIDELLERLEGKVKRESQQPE